MERWHTRTVRVQPGVGGDVIRLDEVLAEGWEPFSVTWGDGTFVYHLRMTQAAKEEGFKERGKKAPEIPVSKRGY